LVRSLVGTASTIAHEREARGRAVMPDVTLLILLLGFVLLRRNV
jgi:hypothetical protein